MNEASSKFVDTLAIEKLVKEKLTKVSHSPHNSHFYSVAIPLDQLKKYSLEKNQVKKVVNPKGLRVFSIPSFHSLKHHKENDAIHLYDYSVADAKGNILLVHGLFDDNIFNYTFLIKSLNELKLNVFFMVLPYHYDRKPESSLFSGEYFLSGDIHRSQFALKQAIYDIEASLQFIGTKNDMPTMLVGFSMGGCISLRYHLLVDQAVKLFIINPVTKLTTLVWDNPLLVSVGRDIQSSGFNMDEYYSIFKELDPCENLTSKLDVKNIAMVYSAYDQMIALDKYEAFIRKTGIKKTHLYSSGHLNVLRVPRLAKDIYDFYME